MKGDKDKVTEFTSPESLALGMESDISKVMERAELCHFALIPAAKEEQSL
jgi:hypothetical protein